MFRTSALCEPFCLTLSAPALGLPPRNHLEGLRKLNRGQDLGVTSLWDRWGNGGPSRGGLTWVRGGGIRGEAKPRPPSLQPRLFPAPLGTSPAPRPRAPLTSVEGVKDMTVWGLPLTYWSTSRRWCFQNLPWWVSDLSIHPASSGLHGLQGTCMSASPCSQSRAGCREEADGFQYQDVWPMGDVDKTADGESAGWAGLDARGDRGRQPGGSGTCW